MSRATHQKYVHIDDSYEGHLMTGAKLYAQKAMGDGGEAPGNYDGDARDDIDDSALYFNDPDEVSAAELAMYLQHVEPALALEDPGHDADIAQYFGGEGLFMDVEVESDGDVVT